eukprot:gb/GECG01005439.1/.p1 GENE.gb/GECG01005439.1/~~gb/GECG01005439.1/.p1  ORF type:complete len:113 (+),score=8.55 gb/GECG01005439.1/:1-339(+)
MSNIPVQIDNPRENDVPADCLRGVESNKYMLRALTTPEGPFLYTMLSKSEIRSDSALHTSCDRGIHNDDRNTAVRIEYAESCSSLEGLVEVLDDTSSVAAIRGDMVHAKVFL